MKYIIWFISIFLLLVFQAGVLVPLHLAPVNLILVLVVTAVLLADFNLAIGLTLAGGLMLDFISGVPDGLVTMSLLLVFLFLYFVVNYVLSREASQLVLFTSVAVGTASYYLFFLAFDQIFGIFHLNAIFSVNYLLTVELPATLLFNLIFTYPIYLYFLQTQKFALKITKHEQPI